MATFIVDLYLDGYDTEEEAEEACAEFIYEQLNMTASCVKITPITDMEAITLNSALVNCRHHASSAKEEPTPSE